MYSIINILKRQLHYSVFPKKLSKSKAIVRFPSKYPNLVDLYINYHIEADDRFSRKLRLRREKTETFENFAKRIKVVVNFGNFIRLKKEKILDVTEDKLKDYDIEDVGLRINNISLTDEQQQLNDLFINENVSLMLNKHNYNVVLNPPWVNIINLPKYIICDNPVVAQIEIDYGNFKDFEYKWIVSKDTKKWEEIDDNNNIIFVPKSEYLSYYVCVICSNRVTGQVLKSRMSLIIANPNQDVMINRWKETPDYLLGNNEFRVMSYNILAEVYSNSKYAFNVLFKHCDTNFLEANYRQMLLLKEIESFKNDIICLQEVDKEAYTKSFNIFFVLQGFDSSFTMKNMNTKEGVAIFWRTSKFKLMKTFQIEQFNKYVLNNTDGIFEDISDFIKKDPQLLITWELISHCLSACLLESVHNPQHQLLVVNSHLFFRDDNVRQLQLAIILRYLYYNIDTTVCRPSILHTGDFNDERGSDVINFMMGKDSNNFPFSNPYAPLSSAYSYNEFTNFVPQFSAELDYIFYQSNSLLCKRTIDLPCKSEMIIKEALPNKSFPSDHLSLVAEFEFINNEKVIKNIL